MKTGGTPEVSCFVNLCHHLYLPHRPGTICRDVVCLIVTDALFLHLESLKNRVWAATLRSALSRLHRHLSHITTYELDILVSLVGAGCPTQVIYWKDTEFATLPTCRSTITCMSLSHYQKGDQYENIRKWKILWETIVCNDRCHGQRKNLFVHQYQ